MIDIDKHIIGTQMFILLSYCVLFSRANKSVGLRLIKKVSADVQLAGVSIYCSRLMKTTMIKTVILI